MSKKYQRPDIVYLVAVGVLLLIGLIVLASASAPVGFERFGDTYFFLKRQILYGVIPGLALASFFYFFDYKRLHGWYWLYYIATLVLLAIVYIPGIGLELNNSRSWIQIGGFALQPGEFAKLPFALFLAHWLDERGRTGVVRFWKDFVPFVLLIGLPALLLIQQPDTGTMGIFIGMACVLLVVARARLLHIAGLLLLILAMVAGLIAAAPYRADRIMTFLHPELDPQGVGYHINQAFLAIGSGGVWGLGYGNSRQKFQYLPEVSADSIFAVFAEEMGFIISLLLIGLIAFVFLRGLHIARRASDQFGMYVAVAITAWIGVQSFINIAAMLGLLPLTGVPLPFISHGGSALLVGLASVGIMLNISRQMRSVD